MKARTTVARKPLARAATGVPGLDDVLSGGLPSGHLYLVEGDPGTGKTTIGLQFLMQGAVDAERGLYITFSETKQEIIQGGESHGWDLGGIDIFEVTPTEQSLRPEDQYSHFHPSEVEFQDTTQHILEKIEQAQPHRVVFDSLSELRLLARDSLRYRRQILALKHYFVNRNCTVLLLDDRTADVNDRQLQSIAHGVILLERLPREYGIERRRVRVAKLRGSRFREGFHDYTIETGGVAVYPRLVAGEHRQEEPDGVTSSGIASLDHVWGGGIPRGTSTLVVGPAGSGKSSIVTAYAVAAAERRQVAAIFNFDETLSTIYRRSEQLGMDLRPHVTSGQLRMHQVDPAELSPGQFVTMVRTNVEQHGAQIVVIDSLNGFLQAMSGEQMLVSQMHELLTYLSQRGVTTLLVLTQAGFLGTQMAAPVDLTYLSDNVLVLRYFEAEGRVRKAVSILKKRSGAHEDAIRELRFLPSGIEVGQRLENFHGILTGVPTLVTSPGRSFEAAYEPEG